MILVTFFIKISYHLERTFNFIKIYQDCKTPTYIRESLFNLLSLDIDGGMYTFQHVAMNNKGINNY